jgi:hypothetical protein
VKFWIRGAGCVWLWMWYVSDRSRFTIHTMFFLIWYLFGIIIYHNLLGLTLTSFNWKERNCFCASVPAAILFICKWYYYNSMIVYLLESAKDINYLHCLNPHLCIGIDHPLTYLLVGGRWRNDFIIQKNHCLSFVGLIWMMWSPCLLLLPPN